MDTSETSRNAAILLAYQICEPEAIQGETFLGVLDSSFERNSCGERVSRNNRRLTHIPLPQYEFGWRLIEAAKSFVAALEGNLSLLVVGILVLLVTGALDRILFQPLLRHRRHA